MKIDLGCYYFPNYHTDDTRNNVVHGNNWSEWEPVRNAIPRFVGHRQPRVPLWGETDEKNPQQMAQKIDAAAKAGIDVFIFDWYYYNDGPFLEKALEEGFMKAPNRNKLKFCNMWANHDWYDIHPAPPVERKLLYPGKVTRETFEKIAQIHIDRYFSTPEYYTIDGAPYFSIYELTLLAASFGSMEETRKALNDFRIATKTAGFADLHLNAIIWGQPILPGESTPQDAAEFAVELGFDSVASYVWAHHFYKNQQQNPYENMRNSYFNFWDKTVKKCPVEYFPNITVGWDTAARTMPDQPCDCMGSYPYGPVIVGNTPEEFALSVKMVKEQYKKLNPKHPFISINSWNEWTEGSYLEPDTEYAYQYLDAIANEFPENVH